jgi:hypothetical protein
MKLTTTVSLNLHETRNKSSFAKEYRENKLLN